jgi:hypothetical protein
MEAIDHEAETVLIKKTDHHKICPAPARPRARQSRSLESPQRPKLCGDPIGTRLAGDHPLLRCSEEFFAQSSRLDVRSGRTGARARRDHRRKFGQREPHQRALQPPCPQSGDSAAARIIQPAARPLAWAGGWSLFSTRIRYPPNAVTG